MHFAMTNITQHKRWIEGGDVGGGKSNNITFGKVFLQNECMTSFLMCTHVTSF